MNIPNISILIDGCRQLNISLTDGQIEQFVRFFSMLTEKNKVMNLTAITGWNDVVTKHFLDSLLIVRAFDINDPGENIRLLDMGTGAGFPGIPLKIAFPQLDVTMVDSLNKRITFINEVINELQLERTCAIHARAEDLGKQKDFREKYDVVVSRAVANLSSLSEYCLPFVRVGGYFISYKSADINTELKNSRNAVEMLGGNLEQVKTFALPLSGVERSFVIIKKIRATAGKYPRRSGIPSRQPL